jgi:hypothetical protein
MQLHREQAKLLRQDSIDEQPEFPEVSLDFSIEAPRSDDEVDNKSPKIQFNEVSNETQVMMQSSSDMAIKGVRLDGDYSRSFVEAESEAVVSEADAANEMTESAVAEQRGIHFLYNLACSHRSDVENIVE